MNLEGVIARFTQIADLVNILPEPERKAIKQHLLKKMIRISENQRRLKTI